MSDVMVKESYGKTKWEAANRTNGFKLVNVVRKPRWRNGHSVGRAINRSWVQILLGAKLRNYLGQVVHTYVPLTPSSVTWYQPRGSDALRLGR